MSQASLLLKKICNGFNSTELAKLTAFIVITLPFQWATLCDSILQFQQRIRSSNPQQNVNAIWQKEVKKPTCFKWGGRHLLHECRALFCKYCGGQHKNKDCAKNGQPTYCVKCKSKYHNVEGHFKHFPSNQTIMKPNINVIEATWFLEGAISMDMECSGKNFIDTKLLIDTGALIPSGIAIIEQFFINNLGENVEKLFPSNLNSAIGASSISTMETVGQLEVRIRFNNLSTIFTGSAFILKNLSPPVIIGINFLKSNSMSPILDPSSAHIVHSPSKESQELIANLNNRPVDDELLDRALPAVYRHKTLHKDKSLVIMYTNLSDKDIVISPNQLIGHGSMLLDNKSKPNINVVKKGVKDPAVTERIWAELKLNENKILQENPNI